MVVTVAVKLLQAVAAKPQHVAASTDLDTNSAISGQVSSSQDVCEFQLGESLLLRDSPFFCRPAARSAAVPRSMPSTPQTAVAPHVDRIGPAGPTGPAARFDALVLVRLRPQHASCPRAERCRHRS